MYKLFWKHHDNLWLVQHKLLYATLQYTIVHVPIDLVEK